MTGTIRTLHDEKGFGFIRDEAGKDYFFHRTALSDEGFGDLRSGDRVEFDIGEGAKGPRAENVRRTGTQANLPKLMTDDPCTALSPNGVATRGPGLTYDTIGT